MKKLSVLRDAMSMLEVIFVIIILGIVSSIGAEIIANVYESYIVQRAQYRAAMKTELALNQIANRLRYAIPGTVFANNGIGGLLLPIVNINQADSDRLQWVAYDGDSFEAYTAGDARPGWSGFLDLDASNTAALATPGSNLNLVNTIVHNFGGVVLNTVRIYFPENGGPYAVNALNNQTITLTNNIPSGNTIYERYKLAWSSYALTVENGDLFLYYNFTPTPGFANLPQQHRSLLLRNVTNFRFQGSEGALRVKICKEEPIGNSTVHTCKEKVIF